MVWKPPVSTQDPEINARLVHRVSVLWVGSCVRSWGIDHTHARPPRLAQESTPCVLRMSVRRGFRGGLPLGRVPVRRSCQSPDRYGIGRDLLIWRSKFPYLLIYLELASGYNTRFTAVMFPGSAVSMSIQT